MAYCKNCHGLGSINEWGYDMPCVPCDGTGEIIPKRAKPDPAKVKAARLKRKQQKDQAALEEWKKRNA